MNFRRRSLDRVLGHAERTVALLDRCRPLNAKSEAERLLGEWRAGRVARPAWVYALPGSLADVRTALDTIAERGVSAGAWGKLYAERAQELSLEAAAVEALGEPGFRSAAARRFPIESGGDGSDADALAESWSTERCSADPSEPRSQSDDDRDPESLISALRRAVGERRLPFRVVPHPELPSAAATGDGILLVRTGVWHTRSEVRRIVIHEIEAHAMPRSQARSERLGLFRVGTAGGSDDEEGRAVLLEERAGCLDARRRAQLGRRHLAALAVRSGADWVETVRALEAVGAPLADALDLAARAHRGGGLGREIVYLTALCRVRRALAADPEIESWMERGRISVAAAPILRELGEPPELLGARDAA